MMQDCLQQSSNYSVISHISSDLNDYLETRNTIRFIARVFKNINDTSIISAQEGVRTQMAKLSEELHIAKNGNFYIIINFINYIYGIILIYIYL